MTGCGCEWCESRRRMDQLPEPILAMFRALPEPDSLWCEEKRLAWIRAMERLFELFYQCEDVPTVESGE